MTSDSPRWFKSSYSNNGGQCVEVATDAAPTRGTVLLRDSKNPDGPQLAVPAAAFGALVDALQSDGRFA